MDTPEIHGPHKEQHRGATPRWLDLSVAVAALVTSIVSIVLGLQNGSAMQQLVQAQSWPNLSFDSSNSVDGKRMIKLSVRSTGSGPVLIKSLVLRYKGQPVKGWRELLRACCAAPGITDAELIKASGNAVLTGSSRGALLPGDVGLILSIGGEDAQTDLYKKLDVERNNIDYDACYCSVFSECYRTNGSNVRDPRPVKQCAISKNEWNGLAL